MVLKVLRDITAPAKPFNLMDLPGFPYSLYNDQITAYTEMERWFTGTALDDQSTNNQTDLYPMRINPIQSVVFKHAHMLFGDARGDGRPLVTPSLIYDPETAGEKERAHEAQEVLINLWDENHAPSLMIEAALLDQIYGGHLFKASYAPWEWDKYGGLRTIPMRIETISPKAFVGIPESGNAYNLVEAWIVQTIFRAEAQMYGYTGTDETVWYVEHWTRTEYEIIVDGKPAYRMAGNDLIDLKGPNPWGFIPMVYIPNLRIGSFLGTNSFMNLVGMVKEMNARWGDYGDAVNDDSHPLIAERNINGTVQMKRINNWLEVVDLGGTTGLSTGEKEPDMFQIGTPRSSPAMGEMIDGIFKQFQRDASVPPVAWGEDEGSQRSGTTLEIRFHPLTSYAQMQRYFWAPGLNVFDKFLLRMLWKKNLFGITEQHIRMRIKQTWPSFLPKDRETLVNEFAIRASNTIASVEHLIEMAGDVDDTKEERERILQWITDVEQVKAKLAADAAAEAAKRAEKNNPQGGKNEGKQNNPSSQ